ncbi:MAG: c-type cytochrome [Flavobacteriales bacterium]|nr:c-type cytochrome [Flavobacteriales bacterium]
MPHRSTSGGHVDTTVNYILMAVAVVQAVIILSLSGILRMMWGGGGAARAFRSGGRGLVLVPFLLMLATEAQAQAYQPPAENLNELQLFWLLVGVNVFLFVILLVQLNFVRGATRSMTTAVEERGAEQTATGPGWAQRLLDRLTRRAAVEQEPDIMLHHNYDGIRELDNVLPPWWVWLFYGSIIWGVIYLINVHVIDIWPVQQEEYVAEMEQAQADIAAYMATLAAAVDENTVIALTDAAALSNGKATFTQFCTPCHGADAAGSETSVGPNLTDAYWIHGGGVKNVFKTIKYGVPEKGMISWKAQLSPAEIQAVASYILSLQGTGPATQKPPQGDPWTENPAATDSTTVRPDTVPMADSTKLAVLR